MRSRNLHLAAPVLAALCSACGPTIAVSNPTLVSGVDRSRGKRIASDSFRLDDRITQFVDFTWADPRQDGGIHDCEWKWYRDGTLVSDTPEKRLDFRSTPFTLVTARAAATLGAGRYTVDTLVDGKVVATSAFTITG